MEAQDYVDFYLDGVATTLISVAGLFGNTLIVVTLSRPQMRSSINLLFTSLACFDTLFLVLVLLLLSIPSLLTDPELQLSYIVEVHIKTMSVLVPIALIAQTASTWTTVSITIERYIAVCHPLKARSLCSYGKARISIVVVIALSVLFNVPQFLRGISTGRKDNDTSDVTLQEEDMFIEVYDMWMYLGVMYLLPFIVFVCLNALIFRSIRIARRKRRSLVQRMENEMNLVKMLLCVVTVYFLCNFSRIVSLLTEYFVSCCEIIENVSFLLQALNSSVNFVIFFLVSGKFRRSFLKIFSAPCRRRGRRGEENDDLRSTTEIQTLRNIRESVNLG